MGAVETAELINKLVEEVDAWKSSVRVVEDSLLSLCDAPIIAPFSDDNIVFRTSRQLEEYLRKNDFMIDTVSRSSVGEMDYYHVEVNVSDEEWDYRRTSSSAMKELLGINGVGLVDFFNYDDMIHEVILIDVWELDDKFLKDGNLIFD